jgi:capsule polysaccharide export protein KpsE/RkpR
MKNFDLNTFGVKELTKSQLIEINGGQSLNPWWYWAKEIAKAIVYVGLELVDDLSNRASKDGYVSYADMGHR